MARGFVRGIIVTILALHAYAFIEEARRRTKGVPRRLIKAIFRPDVDVQIRSFRTDKECAALVAQAERDGRQFWIDLEGFYTGPHGHIIAWC